MQKKPEKNSVRSIAQMLDLSAMTVTRAMNGHPGVSEKTRRQVMEAIHRLGYDYRLKSKSLARERKYNIAIHCGNQDIYGDWMMGFFMKLHYLVVKRFHAEGYCCRLVDLDDAPAEGLEILDDCDGLIVLGKLKNYTARSLRERCSWLKVISVFGSIDDAVTVTPDDFAGGAMAARKLVEFGHSRCVLFSVLDEECYLRRVGGFLTNMRVLAPGSRVEIVEYHTHDTQEAADCEKRRLLDEVLRRTESRPTAFFAPNSYAAFFLYNHLLTRGYKVPEDFSVIGYDNDSPCGSFPARLSSIGFRLKDIGDQLVRTFKYYDEEIAGTITTVVIGNYYQEGAPVETIARAK